MLALLWKWLCRVKLVYGERAGLSYFVSFVLNGTILSAIIMMKFFIRLVIAFIPNIVG